MPPDMSMMGVPGLGRWNVDGRTVTGTMSSGCSLVIHVEHTPLRESSSGVVVCRSTCQGQKLPQTPRVRTAHGAPGHKAGYGAPTHLHVAKGYVYLARPQAVRFPG